MAFRSDVWFLPIARDIEADPMWDSPSRASFGKGQHHEAPPRSD
jgi:hypothetical protein